jgi:hypothetical protein
MSFRIRPFFRRQSFVFGFPLIGHENLLPPVPASPPIKADIHKNPVKPSVKGGVPAKVLKVLKSPQKSLLGQILCVLYVPVCEVVGDRIGLLLIAMHQILYSPLVVLSSSGDKIFVLGM